jgi:hypothetical protein
MYSRETVCSSARHARPAGIFRRVLRWWSGGGTAERYLAGAADLADLERRMRVLERASGGPAFVTFNH